MRKKYVWASVSVLLVVLCYVSGVMMDKLELREKVVRLHVVGASDSDADQAVKLKVRDAVLERLGPVLESAENKEQALRMLTGMRDELTTVADQVLEREGLLDRAKVTVGEQTFPKRDYDTFSLPAGVYDALKITIGDGAGRNWWCVVFPELCKPAATEDMDAVAAGAGFSRGNRGALTGTYEVRFFLLDLLGRWENFFN